MPRAMAPTAIIVAERERDERQVESQQRDVGDDQRDGGEQCRRGPSRRDARPPADRRPTGSRSPPAPRSPASAAARPRARDPVDASRASSTSTASRVRKPAIGSIACARIGTTLPSGPMAGNCAHAGVRIAAATAAGRRAEQVRRRCRAAARRVRAAGCEPARRVRQRADRQPDHRGEQRRGRRSPTAMTPISCSWQRRRRSAGPRCTVGHPLARSIDRRRRAPCAAAARNRRGA